MEAFDQPWKRPIEGTVGAYWGLLDVDRAPKFAMSGPVVENTWWPAQAAFAGPAGDPADGLVRGALARAAQHGPAVLRGPDPVRRLARHLGGLRAVHRVHEHQRHADVERAAAGPAPDRAGHAGQWSRAHRDHLDAAAAPAIPAAAGRGGGVPAQGVDPPADLQRAAAPGHRDPGQPRPARLRELRSAGARQQQPRRGHLEARRGALPPARASASASSRWASGRASRPARSTSACARWPPTPKSSRWWTPTTSSSATGWRSWRPTSPIREVGFVQAPQDHRDWAGDRFQEMLQLRVHRASSTSAWSTATSATRSSSTGR